jgi:N6-L-threonylcarbamoyladenine synthase
MEHIMVVVRAALDDAGIDKQTLDAIAFTRGPGLMGSLIVGVSFAKSLALSLDIPLIEVQHMHAHVMSHFIEDPKPHFPFLCLTVSGGHTQIIRVTDYLEFELLGQTLDDAAGEAFDKAGKMLGLDYPAGPIIDKLAAEGNVTFDFPKAQVPGLDFSFSGLKTAILYFLRDQRESDPGFIEKHLSDIAASVQCTIVDMLAEKVIMASEQTGIDQIAIAGGVSANKGLRSRLTAEAEQRGWQVFIPKLEYCTDNAAMIAVTAYYKYLRGKFADLDVSPDVRMAF